MHSITHMIMLIPDSSEKFVLSVFFSKIESNDNYFIDYPFNDITYPNY